MAGNKKTKKTDKSKKKNEGTNWPLAAGIYLFVVAVIAGGFRLLPLVAHQFIVDPLGLILIVAIVGVAIVIGIFAWIKKVADHDTGKHLHKVVTHWGFATFVMAWLGLGFFLVDVARAFLLAPHDWLALAGPLGVLSYVKHHGVRGLAMVVTYIALNGLVVEQLVIHRDRIKKGATTEVVKKVIPVGADRAPKEMPKGGHYDEIITTEIEPYIAEIDEADNKLILVATKLADKLDGIKRKVWLCLPDMGHAIVTGATRAGKSIVLIRMMLNQLPREEGELPIKFVVLTNAPQDLAGPLAPYLRGLGPVEHLNLVEPIGSESLFDDPKFGDPVRWDPDDLVSVEGGNGWPTAVGLAQKVIEASKANDPAGGRHSHFEGMCASLLGACFLTARWTRRSYGDAFDWVAQWTDPSFVLVDEVLREKGETAALREWRNVRTQQLVALPDGTWEEPKDGGALRGNQGNDTATSLGNILNRIDKPFVRERTKNGTFHIKQWVEQKGSATLFLSGTEAGSNDATSAALFVPFLSALLEHATGWAKGLPGQQLPYRMVIVLDEVCALAPVPSIPTYFSTAAKHGIHLVATSQFPGLFYQAFGEGAKQITNNAAVGLFLGSIRDPDSIRMICELSGLAEYEAESNTSSDHGTSTTTSAQYRQLVDGAKLVRQRGVSHKTPDVPGLGLAIVSGGILQIENLLWTVEEPFAQRGAVSDNPAFAKIHNDFLEKLAQDEQRLHRQIVAWWRQKRAPIEVEMPKALPELPRRTGPTPEADAALAAAAERAFDAMTSTRNQEGDPVEVVLAALSADPGMAEVHGEDQLKAAAEKIVAKRARRVKAQESAEAALAEAAERAFDAVSDSHVDTGDDPAAMVVAVLGAEPAAQGLGFDVLREAAEKVVEERMPGFCYHVRDDDPLSGEERCVKCGAVLERGWVKEETTARATPIMAKMAQRPKRGPLAGPRPTFVWIDGDRLIDVPFVHGHELKPGQLITGVDSGGIERTVRLGRIGPEHTDPAGRRWLRCPYDDGPLATVQPNGAADWHSATTYQLRSLAPEDPARTPESSDEPEEVSMAAEEWNDGVRIIQYEADLVVAGPESEVTPGTFVVASTPDGTSKSVRVIELVDGAGWINEGTGEPFVVAHFTEMPTRMIPAPPVPPQALLDDLREAKSDSETASGPRPRRPRPRSVPNDRQSSFDWEA